MIKSFGDKATRDIYDGANSRYAKRISKELHPKICRLLDQINASPAVEILQVPPSNRLEKLKGKMKGFWSLRINDQWRIVFKWEGSDAFEVEIVDYH